MRLWQEMRRPGRIHSHEDHPQSEESIFLPEAGCDPKYHPKHPSAFSGIRSAGFRPAAEARQGDMEITRSQDMASHADEEHEIWRVFNAHRPSERLG